jgi:chromosome segregation ATPase
MDTPSIEERITNYQRQLDVVREKMKRVEESSPKIYINLRHYMNRFKELKGKELDNKEPVNNDECNFVRHQIKTLLAEKEQVEKEYQELKQKERELLLYIEELKPKGN